MNKTDRMRENTLPYTKAGLFQPMEKLEVWFAAGAQHLYGEEALKAVADDARAISAALNEMPGIPVRIVCRPVVTTSDEITTLCREADADAGCVGLIFWMHTFSPAKMWINGLKQLQKPFVHFHTQRNRDIPWSSIDMDFMNLNQTAHGGREFGHICSRLGIERTVIVGHWQDPETVARLGVWVRAAMGWHELKRTKIARFGDNMREVAVTEGDKVAAQMQLGFSVNGYGIGDLTDFMNSVGGSEVEKMVQAYFDEYTVAPDIQKDEQAAQAVREAAWIEMGMRRFLEDGGFSGFTTTFEDLHGIAQLPGLAVQRLMQDGYGFGAEGDWKTSALLHAMKAMSRGLPGGTSFMEDYTYHFNSSDMLVLGAHMLEVCPSIAAGKPSLEVHPLSIGGKADPVRLVFSAPPGPAINAALMDMGNRFRLTANAVEVVDPGQELPHLPVARAVWRPLPDLKTAAAAWILSGAAHHSTFTQALTMEHLEDFAGMAGIELVEITEQTTVQQIKNELRWNEAAYS